MTQTFAEQPYSARSGLPLIKHPLSTLDFNVDTLDVRGFSRDGDRQLQSSSVLLAGRPLAREGGGSALSSHKRYSLLRNYDGGLSEARTNGVVFPPVYDSIPENVEITIGDPNKIRLPIFGNRTAMLERDELQAQAGSRYSRAGSRLSTLSATEKLQTDEVIFCALFKKSQNNTFAMFIRLLIYIAAGDVDERKNEDILSRNQAPV
jgi:hypothetical protein